MKRYRIEGPSQPGYQYEKDRFRITHGSEKMRCECLICKEAHVWLRTNTTILKKDQWMVVHRTFCK